MIVNIKNILISSFFLISTNIIKSADMKAKNEEAKNEEAKDNEDKNAADALFEEKKIEEGKIEIKEAEIKEKLGIKEVEGPGIKKEDIDKYKQEDALKGFEKALKTKINSDEKPGGEINVNQNINPVDYKAKVKEKNSSCCNF